MAVEQLPEETLLLVLQHLAVQGLAAMLATSKRLRGLACETIRLRVEAALRQTVQSYDVLNPVAVLNAVLRHAARAGDGLLVQWLMRLGGANQQSPETGCCGTDLHVAMDVHV